MKNLLKFHNFDLYILKSKCKNLGIAISFLFLSVNYKTAELPKIVFLFLKLKLNLLHKTHIWFLGYLFSISQAAAPTCIYKKNIWE